ncbi:MAG: Holliday junction branch migration protein RuvA [Ignavibacteriae bacterium]|nr:Holliday junction branch migration protein RuvA [Ignavibacteriota bacterium]
MIAQLNGTLIEKRPTEIVIDCGGVGYQVSISLATHEQLPELNTKARIYTLLIPREDALNLYGFSTVAEREAFLMITSISGIGAKSALAILSSITLFELRDHILRNNLIALQKMPGIGKKTAERIIVELRDKIGKLPLEENVGISFIGAQKLVQQDALAALLSLGYNKQIAEKAIRSAAAELNSESVTADLLIKKALRFVV